MAKFTPEEVTALQAGGNEVYVERRFTGERSGGATANLPRIRLNNKEPYENSTRKSNSLRLEFKSPHSSPGVKSDDTGFRYLYDESRSPRYVQKCSRRGSIGRSPIKFEVVDDRFRDDEYRNRRVTNIGSKLRHLSLDGQKSVDRSQPPVLRPLGEIIGESASSLQVTPSGGEGSVEENPSEQISNNPESFIDLSIKPKAFDAVDGVGPETPHMSQASESNWAKFEAPKTPDTSTLSSTTEATPEATFANAIDLLLFELSGPLVPTSGGKSEVPSGDNVPTWDFPPTSMGHTTASPNSTGVSSFTSTTATELTHPYKAAPPQAEPHDAEHFIEVSHAHKPSSIPSVSASCSSTTQPTNAPVKAVVSNNQPSVSPITNDSSRAFTEPFSQTTSKPIQDTRPDVGSQPSRVETKSIGRKELPEDLFTASYLSGPATLAGWQNVQPHAMGYGMQYYPNAVTPSALPIAPMSINPFEVTEGRNLIHTSSLPTMASLQGVLPAVSSRTTGLIHASSLGTLEAAVPQSTSYASPVPPQSPFASGVPTGIAIVIFHFL
ncbi:putative ADP-ribosylation factor GTPase-activating [Sesbania bispinosa]|nr:putative ADP-ribosylation factor GTPase-activating [Sesbania bispinosa]